MTKILFVIACAALVAACSDFARVSRMSPLAPTPVAATPPPPPPPPRVFEPSYTELIAGTTIQRTVDESSNPRCYEHYDGLGCQYFRITPDRDGVLEVELTWVTATQPGQGLDLTRESARGQEEWADVYPPDMVRLRSQVKAGETSQLTVWYTKPGLEFSLRTALQPS